ncbi:MAG: molybdopterin oxidoreductase family protein [Actinobacteria bacterium]|nr:molybdopterin oxidoreductase family protein [Actinomycetota bacterium]
MSVHYRSCNLCEASCGLEITVEANLVIGIRGDHHDPMSRGYLCPKGVAWQDLHNDPDRLRHPVRRTATGWERIGWDEAFDLVASRLLQTKEQHGGDAIAFYLGNPIAHGWGPIILIPMLLKALGTNQRYSAASVDQQPQHLLSYLLFGSPLLLPVPDVDRTDFLLVVGGNPLVSNGSIMTAPNIKRRLEGIRERGGRVVVVDPRRTETARIADAHHFIRPGTDVYLLAAMAQVLFAEGVVKPGAAAAYVDGIEAVGRMVSPFTPEAVAEVTGIGAEEIRQLARDFAGAKRGAVYARLGVCQTVYGTSAYWLVHVLNVLAGRLDVPGGWMLATPAFDLPVIGAKTTDLIGYDRWRSRVRGIPEVAAEFPTVTLADEILTPGDGQVRAMVIVAGNPVLTVPDGRRVDEALADLDFLVSVDYYVNESNRHADVILPPTAALEREEFDVVFPAVSVRNHVRWGPQVLQPAPDTRSDAEILMALLVRIEASTMGPRRAQALDRARRRLLPRRLVDIALRIGPWGIRHGRRLSLRKVQKYRHGLDLGPLEPVLPGRLMTEGKRIRLDHPVVVADWPRVVAGLESARADAAGDGLLLIGRRHLRSNNSWMHNSERLTSGSNHCSLLMNPADAAVRSLHEADEVCVGSRVGEIAAQVAITDDVMPGVVCMPHGWGHGSRDGVGWQHAAAQPGASVNDITDDLRYDPVSGNAAVTALPVTVRAAAS